MLSLRCRFALTHLALSLLAIQPTATAAAAQPTEVWDHAECTSTMELNNVKCTPVRSLTAESGEQITLIIRNTCSSAFEYTTVPIPLTQAEVLLSNRVCRDTVRVPIVHDPRFGGYIVYVTRVGDSKNGNARITLAVRTAEWRVGFAGGFTANGLVDPPYALRESQSQDSDGATVTKYRIVEQDDRRDDLGRSVVSFVHLHHSSWRYRSLRFGPSFGIGIEPDRTSDYYPGVSLLFGDRGAITVGMVIGQTTSLPSGRELGDEVTDANVLATLGQRRTNEWFVGISYSFLGDGAGNLAKPFRGDVGERTPESLAVSDRGASQSGAYGNRDVSLSKDGDGQLLAAGGTKGTTDSVGVASTIVTWQKGTAPKP